MATKDGPDTRWGKPDSHSRQLTVDTSISPGGVLPRQPQDDLDRAGGNARSPRAVGIGPPAPDHVPMPTEQGLGLGAFGKHHDQVARLLEGPCSGWGRHSGHIDPGPTP